eukprot:gene23771-28819_t
MIVASVVANSMKGHKNFEEGHKNFEEGEHSPTPLTSEVPSEVPICHQDEGDANDVTQSALISTLKEAYAERSEKRQHYLNLIAFISFLSLYFVILLLQSAPAEEFRVREGFIETLVPLDENGDPKPFFVSNSEVYDWTRQVIKAIFTPMQCGDSICDIPEEYPAFSFHGCQTDCGVSNATTFDVVLEPRFVGDTQLDRVSYNLCTEQPDSMCWWSEAQKFSMNFGIVRHSALALPDADWKLYVYGLVPSEGLVVGGIVKNTGSNDTETDSDQMKPSIPIIRHSKHIPMRAATVLGRRLTESSSASSNESSSEETQAADASQDSLDDIYKSKWTKWKEELEGAVVSSAIIGSAEYCKELLDNLLGTLEDTGHNCTFNEGQGFGEVECCPFYQELLEANCWCTVAALEDWQPGTQAYVMHDSYFHAATCHSYDSDKYAPQLKGSECPIQPPLLEVEGVNPTACYSLNEMAWGDFYTTTFSLTDFYDACMNAESGWVPSAECCAHMNIWMEHDCFCYDCNELAALPQSYVEHQLDFAMNCNISIPRLHTNCRLDSDGDGKTDYYGIDLSSIPECGNTESIAHSRHTTDAADSNQLWNTNHGVISWSSIEAANLLFHNNSEELTENKAAVMTAARLSQAWTCGDDGCTFKARLNLR